LNEGYDAGLKVEIIASSESFNPYPEERERLETALPFNHGNGLDGTIGLRGNQKEKNTNGNLRMAYYEGKHQRGARYSGA
jgi:hypothetical protein